MQQDLSTPDVTGIKHEHISECWSSHGVMLVGVGLSLDDQQEVDREEEESQPIKHAQECCQQHHGR